jgi:antitoxin component YwqK of YwqJK toxin-antitoxin module
MKERIDRHKDGSIKAKGHTKDGELEGYWEWFRLDGSKLRSGHFKTGKQVGEWTTYDATCKVVKVKISLIELAGSLLPAITPLAVLDHQGTSVRGLKNSTSR